MAKYYQRIIPKGKESYSVQAGIYTDPAVLQDGDKVFDEDKKTVETKDSKNTISTA